MTFDQWWQTLTPAEHKTIGINNARFVWQAAQAHTQDIEVLVGHADLGINNIYLFSDEEERVVPEGRQGIYLCLQTPKRD